MDFNTNGLELDAAAAWQEKTGKDFWKLSPTQQRKVIEQYVGDNSVSE